MNNPKFKNFDFDTWLSRYDILLHSCRLEPKLFLQLLMDATFNVEYADFSMWKEHFLAQNHPTIEYDYPEPNYADLYITAISNFNCFMQNLMLAQPITVEGVTNVIMSQRKLAADFHFKATCIIPNVKATLSYLEIPYSE